MHVRIFSCCLRPGCFYSSPCGRLGPPPLPFIYLPDDARYTEYNPLVVSTFAAGFVFVCKGTVDEHGSRTAAVTCNEI